MKQKVHKSRKIFVIAAHILLEVYNARYNDFLTFIAKFNRNKLNPKDSLLIKWGTPKLTRSICIHPLRFFVSWH